MIEVRQTTDLTACHTLRRTVFIEEQGVSEAEEIDDLDGAALHFLALNTGTPVGTARLLIYGHVGKIGRVCVLANHRRKGVGRALMNAAVDRLRATPEVQIARLGAQMHAIKFYENLGFVAHGPIYDDAGIDHRDMDFAL